MELGVGLLVLQHSRELGGEEVTRSLSTHRLPSRQMQSVSSRLAAWTYDPRTRCRQTEATICESVCLRARAGGWMDAPQTRHAVAATLPRSVSDAGLLALPMLKQQAAPPMWRLHRDAGVAAQHMARLLARPCCMHASIQAGASAAPRPPPPQPRGAVNPHRDSRF